MWGNRHLTEGGYIFHNYTTVTVESKGTAVFIQTDKPVYKPQHRGRPPLASRSEGRGVRGGAAMTQSLAFSSCL